MNLDLEGLAARAAEAILGAQGKTVAFTGAGISAESSIPTFRGKNGLWRHFRAEDLATPEAFERNPKLVWEWYRWRMEIVFRAKPNPAHLALAELERMGLLLCTITQNVDGLHQAAGQKCVVELHGNIRRARCTRCGYRVEFKEPPEEVPPKCPRCGGLLRPDVVWFGEPLPEEAWQKAIQLALSAKTLIVIGTSGIVYPAAMIPQLAKQNSATIIEINVQDTPITEIADIAIRAPASKAMQAILTEVKKQLTQ
jgi:NAD-dependent deacetylase